MSKLNIIYLCIGLFMSTNLFAQPSDSELKNKVNAYYGSSSGIVSIKFEAAKVEKRWVKGQWKYYWSKKYNVKTKTEYPGVFLISYGGVQYNKNGSSYSFDRILGGAPIGYEGIPNPTNSEINAHLKATYDPLTFYSNRYMNYLIKAPNNIQLADNPNWKWNKLNVVSFNVTASFTILTSDIGHFEEQKGLFRVNLQRSVDGITFNPDAKLLKNGKWLPVRKGSKVKDPETISNSRLSDEERKTTKTLAQLNAVRYAEEFKKSLVKIDMPEFKSANHVMQFTHELLLEGDKEKVTSFMFKMMPSNLYEDWSDVVLNQNGEAFMAGVLDDLDNYKVAFCQHPVVKEIGKTYVRFYNRSNRRMNRISVSYNNDRWYITAVEYVVRDEDYAGFEENSDKNCDGSQIFIDAEPEFKTGDKVLIFIGGNWRKAEILKAEMENGGYSVMWGTSNLTEWKFANEVKADPEVDNNAPPKEEIKYEIGEEVAVYYTRVWYKGTVKDFSYEKEGYLIDIPARNIEVWTSTEDMEKLKDNKKSDDKKTEDKNTDSNQTDSKKKKPSLKGKIPKVKIKLR